MIPDGQPRSLREARELRARWQALPRARRRSIEVRGGQPTPAEYDAVRAHTRYLGGWPGAVEWIVAGLAGAAVGHLFGRMMLEGGGYPVSSLVGFVVVWSLVGIPLRINRARRLRRAVDGVDRPRSSDPDGPAETGPTGQVD